MNSKKLSIIAYILSAIDILLVLAMFLVYPKYQAILFVSWVLLLMVILSIMVIIANKEYYQ